MENPEEFLAEYLARLIVANISTDEPNTASAKIIYSELSSDQITRLAKGQPEPTCVIATKFFQPNNLIQ